MNWVDLLHDSRGIRAIFGSEEPSLQIVTLHTVRMHRDGPTLKLTFDTPDFPSDPPRKWLGSNTARIELWFTGIESARIVVDAVTQPVSLNISTVMLDNRELIQLTATAGHVSRIEAISSRVHLSRISAHRN